MVRATWLERAAILPRVRWRPSLRRVTTELLNPERGFTDEFSNDGTKFEYHGKCYMPLRNYPVTYSLLL